MILKEHILRQHAGWSPRSNMHLRYLHYFGNESSESLLQAYGIVPREQQIDQLKLKQYRNTSTNHHPTLVPLTKVLVSELSGLKIYP
ncbi:MAG TPA: hypothetical protein VIP70_10750 [Nitrososphaeraceae archaeon]|jgi:integrase/recombinase XerD